MLTTVLGTEGALLQEFEILQKDNVNLSAIVDQMRAEIYHNENKLNITGEQFYDVMTEFVK